MSDPRSRIPSVDALVASDALRPLLERFPRARVVDAVRATVDEVRARLSVGALDDDAAAPELYAREAHERLRVADRPSLLGVVNATGVVLHTNLGRAPLADAAVAAMREAAAYTNVEYDLEAGARGSRYVHCVSLLRELTGAEDAVVVNNAAAALVLALNTVGLGRGVAVSRGELVEIGGGFRIPEVLERAGARLVEVGSTNRTRAGDYRTVLEEGDVGALLKVHRSNFRISGFTAEATLAELVALAAGFDVPLLHDLGSGLLVDAELLGLPPEPRAAESIATGAGVVVVSGDKLLGGPQAGIAVGRHDLVERMRTNPLCRALRVDKTTLAGLEATLALYRHPERAITEIPTLRMLAARPDDLEARASALAARLHAVGVGCALRPCVGAVGGGTFPGVELPSWGVAIPSAGGADRLQRALRAGSPPVIARIVDDEVLADVRTVLPGQEEALSRRIAEAVARGTAGA